jgi:hypothetical protein
MHDADATLVGLCMYADRSLRVTLGKTTWRVIFSASFSSWVVSLPGMHESQPNRAFFLIVSPSSMHVSTSKNPRCYSGNCSRRFDVVVLLNEGSASGRVQNAASRAHPFSSPRDTTNMRFTFGLVTAIVSFAAGAAAGPLNVSQSYHCLPLHY